MEVEGGDLLGLAAVPVEPAVVNENGNDGSTHIFGPPSGTSDDNHHDLLDFSIPMSTPHHESCVPEPVDFFAAFTEPSLPPPPTVDGVDAFPSTASIQDRLLDDPAVLHQDDGWGSFVTPTTPFTADQQDQPLDLFGDACFVQASTTITATTTTTIGNSSSPHFDPFSVPSLTTASSHPDPFALTTTAEPSPLARTQSSSHNDDSVLDQSSPAPSTSAEELWAQNDVPIQQQQQDRPGCPPEATKLALPQGAPLVVAAAPASSSESYLAETIGPSTVIEAINESALIVKEPEREKAPETLWTDPSGVPIEHTVDSVEDKALIHSIKEKGESTTQQRSTETSPSSPADGLADMDEQHSSRQSNGQELSIHDMAPPPATDESSHKDEERREENEESVISRDPMKSEAAVSVISSAPVAPEPQDMPMEDSKPDMPEQLKAADDLAKEKPLLVPAPTEGDKLPVISVDKALNDDQNQEDMLSEDPGEVATGSESKGLVLPPESLQSSLSAHSEPTPKMNGELQPELVSPGLVASPPPAGGNRATEALAGSAAPPLKTIPDVSDGGSIDPVDESGGRIEDEPPMESSSDVLVAANKSLLERIEQLEKELQDSQLKVVQLQEHEAKYQKDASLQVSLLDELQTNLETQMNKRAEAENNVRRALAAANATKEKFEKLKSDSQQKIKGLEDKITDSLAAQSAMEVELHAATKRSDESTMKEASMALRLNEIIKGQGETGNAVKYYETQVDKLKDDLETTKTILGTTMAERDQLSEEVAQWKAYAESRSKQLEKSLDRERTLNKDRKRKMKEFVEAKTEEVRVAKSDTMGLQTEIEQTNLTLKDLNQRYKQLHTQWVEAQTRNRELQRDITKMKMDSEKMSKVGGTLEAKLSRSAQESEDHKNKRLAAKNEVMAVLRQLEVERDVNHRLRESIKEIFTPKALSQQQSLRDLVDNLEGILQKVAVKLGRPIPPPTRNQGSMDPMADEGPENLSSAGDGAAAIPEANMQRAINKLENETKRVTQYIQAATNTTGRLQSVVDTPSTRGCVGAFSSFLLSPHADGTSASSSYT